MPCGWLRRPDLQQDQAVLACFGDHQVALGIEANPLRAGKSADQNSILLGTSKDEVNGPFADLYGEDVPVRVFNHVIV